MGNFDQLYQHPENYHEELNKGICHLICMTNMKINQHQPMEDVHQSRPSRIESIVGNCCWLGWLAVHTTRKVGLP